MILGKRKRHYYWVTSFLVFLTFLFIPSHISAIELKDIPGNIHIGPLKIHPGLSIKGEYTDNIFHEASGESGSSITTLSPGIVLQLPYQRHFLEIDYRADIIEASRFHRVYDTDSHFADIMLKLGFKRLNIIAGNNWKSDSDIII